MKNLLIAGVVISSLVTCPVVLAHGSEKATKSQEATQEMKEIKKHKKKSHAKKKRHGKKRHHQKSETAAEKMIDKETELTNR